MRRFVIAGLLVLAPGLAWAQGAGKDLNEDWIGLQVMLGHVQRDMAALVGENNGAAGKAAVSEARLKWVLDNWVGKPPAALPSEAKP